MERDIQKEIREKLREIEEKEQVFILRAVKQASGEGSAACRMRQSGSLLKRSCAARSSLRIR